MKHMLCCLVLMLLALDAAPAGEGGSAPALPPLMPRAASGSAGTPPAAPAAQGLPSAVPGDGASVGTGGPPVSASPSSHAQAAPPTPADATEAAGGQAVESPLVEHTTVLTPGYDIAAISARWTQRQVRLPRLAANLVTRSVPVQRPLPTDYRIKAGDRVRVVVWGGQMINEIVPVQPNGDVAVPGFGFVPVAGLTEQEAQARVLELVRSHFKQGGAVVAVEQPQVQAVTVVGEVGQPGYLVLPPGGTVLEALAAAGGVLERGSLRRIRVSAPGQAAQDIDLYRIALEGDTALLAPLPSNAVVFVPLSGPQVQVFGAVQRSASIELMAGASLAEAIRLAGGLRVEAEPDTLRLLREEPDGQRLYTLRLQDLEGFNAQDGDRLLVTVQRDLDAAARAIVIRGAVHRPGSYPFNPGLTVEQAIQLAGGLLPQGDPRGISVRRLLPEPHIVIENGVPATVYYALFAAVEMSFPLVPLDEVTVGERPLPDPQRVGVSIEGAVAHPGRYAYSPNMTLRDLLVLAGMLLPHAVSYEALLVRSTIDAQGGMSVTHQSVDLRDIIHRHLPGPILEPGDIVIVRSLADRRIRVTLRGEFRTTGTLALPAGATVGDAVRLAGGILPEAFPRGMRLFRQSEAEIARQFLADLTQRVETAVTINRRAALEADEESRTDAERDLARQEALLLQMRRATATGRLAGIDFACILAGTCKDELVLQDGDVLELPARPGTIRVIGEVMSPGSLAFVPELSVKEMIRRSGGYTRQADREAVFVVRADGSVVATAQGDTMAWDYERRRWARTTLSSLKLEEGDTVIVPADLRYKDSNRRIIRDWTQIMFQIAATVGTIAVVAK